jgi:glycosyltransferase involved in cell wall biosynthesis
VIDRLEVGGAERVFLDLTYLLLNEGVQVDTLLISGHGSLFQSIDPRAGKYFLNRKWKFNPFKMFECATVCSKYQIVHVHMRHTYAYVRLAQMISFKKFKIIFHDHYGDIGINSRMPFNLKGLFKPTYYIGVSGHLVNWAVSKLSIDNNKAFLLGNTVIPTTEGIQMNPKQDLVMVSNIRSTKNIELAIELSNKLGRNLTVYGNMYPSEYSENILKLIETSPYVKLIQGETNVQRFFGNYSLALHTAHSETGPLVLIEYLAKGLPFLAHATGEVADVLKHEIPECFMDSLEVTQWEEKIKYLEDAAPSSEKLKSLFGKYFGTQQYVEKCLGIYQKILA